MVEDKKVTNRLVQERIRKIDELKELGINPYPHTFNKTHSSIQIKNDNKLSPEESNESYVVSVAGRVMTKRLMGKAAFIKIQDGDGIIQIYYTKNDLGPDTFKAVTKKLDIGDFVGFKGHIFCTKLGEITVYAKEAKLLTKSLRPLPEKFHGLQDKELRYRKRYLDLIMNPKVKETFKKRSIMISALREFFAKRNFMEVETPVLQVQYGGAEARPFVTHINAWNMPMYLSISPELYLKRLIVGGFEKVFTICKNFRNEGIDMSHNPEFTMLECYEAYSDYNDMMKIVEEAYEFACLKMNGTTKVTHHIKQDDGTIKEVVIDFKAPWKRVKMVDIIKDVTSIDVMSLDESALKSVIESKNIEIEGEFSWGKGVLALYEEFCEKTIIQPTHVIDHPQESTPLCKLHRNGDKRFIERFESFCLGFEMCNAYTELNDPIRQRKLLEDQAAQLRAGFDESHPMDEDFVEAIETGLPPTGGLGWGVDRMAIFLTGSESIRDVILFPTMKPLETKTKDKKSKK